MAVRHWDPFPGLFQDLEAEMGMPPTTSLDRLDCSQTAQLGVCVCACMHGAGTNHIQGSFTTFSAYRVSYHVLCCQDCSLVVAGTAWSAVTKSSQNLHFV